MPGIFSRQGVGAGAPFGYVCHSIISYLDCPFALTGLGAFLLYVAKIPGVEGSTFLSLVHREGHFSTRSDPRMRGNVAGLAGGDGQVYDVDHIAGLCGDEVRVRACVLVRRGSRPGVTKDFLGHFFG